MVASWAEIGVRTGAFGNVDGILHRPHLVELGEPREDVAQVDLQVGADLPDAWWSWTPWRWNRAGLRRCDSHGGNLPKRAN